MGLELPVVSAVMARLPHPEISLAAYGGVVFPISMIVEAPIIMLLSASTALSKDWHSYRLVRAFMMRAGFVLTALHVLVAFTPLYGIIVGGLIHPPAEILGPARLGLMVMTPWTWSIAYRRFHQGVLIRDGRSHMIGIGTIVRLSANVLVLAGGWALGRYPGILVGSSAVAAGVVAEAVFVGFAVRPVLRDRLRHAPPVDPPLTFAVFRRFYVPLAMTSFLGLVGAPVVSAALGRMPRALDSLAVWPVINGVTFILRSLGFAFNEVVVALFDEPGAVRALRRFAMLLGAGTSAVLLAVAVGPVARFYFGRLSALSPVLTVLAAQAIWIVVPMPFLSAFQSLHQGSIVHGRKTRGITEAVGIFLAGNCAVLLALSGTHWPGLFVGLAAFVTGSVLQLLWLRHRSGISSGA